MRKLIIITVIESFTLFTARALREVIRGQDLGRSSRKCAFIQRKSLAGIFPNFSQIVRATYGTKFQPGFCWGIRVQKVSIKVKKEDVNVWPMRAKVLALYEIGSFFSLSLSQRRILCDCGKDLRILLSKNGDLSKKGNWLKMASSYLQWDYAAIANIKP